MAAPKGNEYWTRRKTHGKPKAIETPEKLWDYFCDYAQLCEDNPITITETKSTKGKYPKTESKVISKPIPFTWDGFEDYLMSEDIISHLGDYESNKDKRYDDYATIISSIKRCIRNQKFQGAAIGIFNANIIARDLGLADKVDLGGDLKISKAKGIELPPNGEE